MVEKMKKMYFKTHFSLTIYLRKSFLVMQKHISNCFKIFIVVAIFSLSACTQEKQPAVKESEPNTQLVAYNPTINKEASDVGPDFKSYWYQGKAELSSFHLEQARYGEIHKGHAVLIFVTEDFWTDKQVKYEFGKKTKDVVSVLKLNFTKKFNTGIYPYSLMTSSFTPIEGKSPLKLSSSMQEWCGQAYMQINQTNKGYDGLYHSYFQAEADQNFKLAENVVFEDGIWNQIRKNPKKLPEGEFMAVPDLMYLRMFHKEPKAYKAKGKYEANRVNAFYTLEYPELGRTIRIQFETPFPHQILGWEEKRNGLTTKAFRKKTLMLPYWGLNGVSDSTYRKQLELP